MGGALGGLGVFVLAGRLGVRWSLRIVMMFSLDLHIDSLLSVIVCCGSS